MKLLANLLFISLIITSFPVYSQTKQDGKGVGVRNISQLPSKDKRWALIIGVDDYQDDNISDLRGAANDAKALADSLEKYAGFPQDQIVLLTTSEPSQRQPTRANILRRISNLKSLVPKDGLLLVSFSGHGIERSNRAFLIPSDATSTDDIDLLEETALSVDNVKRQIKSTGVQQVLFLLDACRNDPTSGRSESTNPLTEAYKRGFSFDVANKEIEAFATIYATSVGARAYEFAEKRQGYFSWAIVEGLSGKAANSNGEVTLGSLVKYVAERVPKMVQIDLGGSKLQRPFAQIEGYKADELVIAIGGSVQPIPTTRPTPNIVNSKSGEDVLWEEVTRLNSKSAYQSYLNEYPNGKYISDARLRVQELDSDQSQRVRNEEKTKWQEAERLNTIESYRNFLKSYPNGEFKALANLKINELEQKIANEAITFDVKHKTLTESHKGKLFISANGVSWKENDSVTAVKDDFTVPCSAIKSLNKGNFFNNAFTNEFYLNLLERGYKINTEDGKIAEKIIKLIKETCKIK